MPVRAQHQRRAHGVTERQHHDIGAYVRYCADQIGLRDWTLRVDITDDADLRATDDHDGSGEVWGAACEPVRGRKYATIKLGAEVVGVLEDGDRESFRQTIAHELTHCHLAPLWEQLRLDTIRHFGQSTYDVFIASAERNMEYAVDAIGDAIAPRLPLIRKRACG